MPFQMETNAQHEYVFSQKKYVEQQSERMLFEEILFPPFGQAFYTKNILLNIELLTSVKD